MNGRAAAAIDDEALVLATVAGQAWAQREVWYRFAPMVYSLLRRSLSSRHDHEDLVQEVFLRVFSRLDSLENLSAVRSFVYSVAVRVLRERIRSLAFLQRTREQLSLVEAGRAATSDVESREILSRVQRVLDGLNDKHRVVFVLRHVEQMELHEIAEGLDLSMATVKRYLTRAMRSIQRAKLHDEAFRLAS